MASWQKKDFLKFECLIFHVWPFLDKAKPYAKMIKIFITVLCHILWNFYPCLFYFQEYFADSIINVQIIVICESRQIRVQRAFWLANKFARTVRTLIDSVVSNVDFYWLQQQRREALKKKSEKFEWFRVIRLFVFPMWSDQCVNVSPIVLYKLEAAVC